MSIKRQTQIMEQGQEGLTGYTATITSDHAYIHDGIAFTAIINTGSISAAYDIAFTTPTVASGKYIHWRPLGITSSANYVDVQISETETYTGGTAVTPINRNRLSSGVTSMQAFVYGATATPAGTIIYKTGIGASGNPTARSGGGGGADEELVLKQNTTYLVTATPAGATILNMSYYWYEESAGLD